MHRHCFAWTDLPDADLPRGVGKRSLEGSGGDLVRVRVPAGTKAARHSHNHEQFVQVIEGSGRLETEEGEAAFGPGSLFHFPKDTWHSAEFDSDTILIETNFKR
jgi:quercetin dioxygenase-like cupin family protein